MLTVPPGIASVTHAVQLPPTVALGPGDLVYPGEAYAVNSDQQWPETIALAQFETVFAWGCAFVVLLLLVLAGFAWYKTVQHQRWERRNR